MGGGGGGGAGAVDERDRKTDSQRDRQAPEAVKENKRERTSPHF